jgi:hypothetical protein
MRADEAKNTKASSSRCAASRVLKNRTIAEDATDVIANMHDLARQAGVSSSPKIPIASAPHPPARGPSS